MGESQADVFNQLLAMVESEFLLAGDELEQLRGLVGEAGLQLSDSFTGLQLESDQQQGLLRELLTELSQLTGSDDKLSEDASEFFKASIAMVKSAAETAESWQKAYLQLAEQSRHLIEASKGISESESLQPIISQVENCLIDERLASSPIGNLANSNQHIWNDMLKICKQAEMKSARIHQIAVRIQEHVVKGTISLQFEDMTQQLASHLQNRMQILNSFIEKAKSIFSASSAISDDTHQQLGQLALLIHESNTQLAQLHKAVEQKDLSEGGVELF